MLTSQIVCSYLHCYSTLQLEPELSETANLTINSLHDTGAVLSSDMHTLHALSSYSPSGGTSINDTLRDYSKANPKELSDTIDDLTIDVILNYLTDDVSASMAISTFRINDLHSRVGCDNLKALMVQATGEIEVIRDVIRGELLADLKGSVAKLLEKF